MQFSSSLITLKLSVTTQYAITFRKEIAMKHTIFNTLIFIHCLLCITSYVNAVHEHGTELVPPSSSTTIAAKDFISTSASNGSAAPLNKGLLPWLKTQASKELAQAAIEPAPIWGSVIGFALATANEFRKERILEEKIKLIEHDIKEVQHLPIRCQVAHPDTPCKNITSIFGWTGKCYVTLFYTDLVVNGKSVKFATLDNWEEVLTALLRELAIAQEEDKQTKEGFNKSKKLCKAGALGTIIGGAAGLALRMKYGHTP